MTWIISKALMNSLYSQEQVEEFLGDTSSDGEQSALSSGNPIPQAFCAPDKMTAFSRLSRYGMTYKPLTEDLGEELCKSYREVFLVRTSVPQEKELESRESDLECGEKWRGSFVKWDPDSSLWRTHQCSLLGDLEPFSETWPQWGLMRNGECWEQRTLEQTIRGTGYGFGERLPTPTASDYKNQPTSASWKAKGAINYKLSNPEIQAKWATPTTMDSLPPKSPQALFKEATQARPGRSKPANLRDQVSNMQNWPTPNAWDGKRGPRSEEHLMTKKGQVTLVTAVKQAEREKMLPTPNARDWKDGKTAGNRKSPGLGVVAHQLETETGGQLNPTSGQLNPDWVEWLMNWPIKWSELNGFNKNEFERWAQESATPIQSFGEMRTMWWDSDPSQTPLRSQPIKQSEIKHSDSLSDLSWDTTRQREMERSHQGKDLSVLRNAIHIQKSEGENLQSGVWEQTGMDEAQIIPRVGQSIVARMERIKAIGNGQVPLCAASAWRILK